MTNLSYVSGTSDRPLLGITIGDMLDQVVERYPDNEALVSRHQGLRYSYHELREEVDRCARALMALGVAKGERVVTRGQLRLGPKTPVQIGKPPAEASS